MPGRLAIPASTSAWQLAQRSLHFLASARSVSMPIVEPRFETGNSFSLWVWVMEVHGLRATVIGTKQALTAGLSDQ